MARINSTEDRAVRNIKLMAELYYFMAKEIVDTLGEDKGKKAILSAIEKFGQARVQSMYEEAREKGLDINDPNTYQIIRDMSVFGWETNPADPDEITYCPMNDIWEQFGDIGKDLGYLYCHIDYILYEGFGYKIERPLCRSKGDAVCKFNISVAPFTDIIG